VCARRARANRLGFGGGLGGVWLSTLREPLLCVSSFHRLRGAPFAVSERGVEPSCIPRRRATLESVKCPRFCACSGHVD
jgi:hypothetical protein